MFFPESLSAPNCYSRPCLRRWLTNFLTCCHDDVLSTSVLFLEGLLLLEMARVDQIDVSADLWREERDQTKFRWWPTVGKKHTRTAFQIYSCGRPSRRTDGQPRRKKLPAKTLRRLIAAEEAVTRRASERASSSARPTPTTTTSIARGRFQTLDCGGAHSARFIGPCSQSEEAPIKALMGSLGHFKLHETAEILSLTL